MMSDIGNKNKGFFSNMFFKKVGKVILYIVGFLLAMVIFFGFLGYYFNNISPKIKGYLREKKAQEVIANMERERESKILAMKGDTYGGATPEKTLDMLIAALEAGDVELASRYYMPEERERILNNFKEQVEEDGDLTYSLTYLSGIEKDGEMFCSKNEKECSFSYKYIYEEEKRVRVGSKDGDILVIPTGGSTKRAVRFELNQFTNVWKISR